MVSKRASVPIGMADEDRLAGRRALDRRNDRAHGIVDVDERVGRTRIAHGRQQPAACVRE
jgi:hypothetical protein